jgi:hypothetical protein
VLIRRIRLGGPAAVRRLARGLGPAASFGGPRRDEGLVGPGEPAQGRRPGGRAAHRAGPLTRPRRCRIPGPAGRPGLRTFAEFGHRGGLLVRGEVAPSGVVPGGSGELGDQKPVSSRHETILIHRTRIERASGYLKQAGKLSRQLCSRVAVGSDIPGCQPPAGTASRELSPGSQKHGVKTGGQGWVASIR